MSQSTAYGLEVCSFLGSSFPLQPLIEPAANPHKLPCISVKMRRNTFLAAIYQLLLWRYGGLPTLVFAWLCGGHSQVKESNVLRYPKK